MKRLVVIGPGAIGGGIAGLVARAGHEVLLVGRGSSVERLSAEGLTIRTPREAFTVSLPVVEGVAQVDWRPGDVALVATKLYDAEAAYDALLAAAGPEVTVITAQNALAGDDWARARFDTVISTMVFLGAQCLEVGQVDLHGSPFAGFVDVDPAGAPFAEVLRSAGLKSTVRPDLRAWQHAKWVTNLCGAAILFGRRDWAGELMDEGRAVFAADGREVVPAEDFFAYVGALGLAPIEGEDRLAGGSTAQSHARGRPLEIPWLNGPVVALARIHGVPVPRNEAVLGWIEAPPDLE